MDSLNGNINPEIVHTLVDTTQKVPFIYEKTKKFANNVYKYCNKQRENVCVYVNSQGDILTSSQSAFDPTELPNPTMIDDKRIITIPTENDQKFNTLGDNTTYREKYGHIVAVKKKFLGFFGGRKSKKSRKSKKLRKVKKVKKTRVRRRRH